MIKARQKTARRQMRRLYRNVFNKSQRRQMMRRFRRRKKLGLTFEEHEITAMSEEKALPMTPDEWNEPMKYTFSINLTPEQAEQFSKAFVQRPIVISNDPEVLKGICEILWRHEFRPFHNGMVRQSTGCSFDWECLLKYKTVVDFQLDWPYS